MNSTSVAVIGLPSTGKSTFAIALYNQLSIAEDSSIRLAKIPAQRAYLEIARTDWLSGTELQRTPVGDGELIELDLLVNEAALTLTIPDLSGETFTRLLSDREVDGAAESLVARSQGLMLFSSVLDWTPRTLLNDALRHDLVDPDQAETPVDFDPRKMPTESQLVDLLQWCSSIDPPEPTRPRNLALVLSAWDAIQLAQISPLDWLAKMPMLQSYLEANVEKFDASVFGVSAQGGTYQSTETLERALRERAYLVREDGGKSFDVTAPVEWALFGSQSC